MHDRRAKTEAEFILQACDRTNSFMENGDSNLDVT